MRPVRGIESVERPAKILSDAAGTLIWCALALPMFYVWAFRAHSIGGSLISGLFALIGVVGLAGTIRQVLDYRRYGEVRFAHVEPRPTVGGELVGDLHVSHVPASARFVRAQLVCNEIRINESGKGRASRSKRLHWRLVRSFALHRVPKGAICRITIPLPDRAGTESGMRYEWELEARIEVPGVDLSRTFPIEVGKRDPALLGAARPEAARATGPAIARSASTPGKSAPSPGSAVSVTAAARVADAEPATDSTTLTALVAANLVPIAGVAFLDWQVEGVVMLYWIENVIIGCMNVLRILGAEPVNVLKAKDRGTPPTSGELLVAKLALVAFFVVHYGAFCAGHGELLAGLMLEGGAAGGVRDLPGVIAWMLTEPAWIVAILSLLVSHLWSYSRNYIGRKEYLRADLGLLMFRPYKRILVTHLFILFGALPILALGSPLGAMIAFVAIKIGIDQHMHRRERAIMQVPA